MGKHKSTDVIGIILLAVSGVMILGMKTFFKPCAKMENGSWRVCHWASQGVLGMGILLAVLALLLILMRSTDTKKGLALAIIPTALLNFLVPDHLMSLCAKETLRCHTSMLPAVRVLSLVIAGVALVELLLLMFFSRRERKQLAEGLADYDEEEEEEPSGTVVTDAAGEEPAAGGTAETDALPDTAASEQGEI